MKNRKSCNSGRLCFETKNILYCVLCILILVVTLYFSQQSSHINTNTVSGNINYPLINTPSHSNLPTVNGRYLYGKTSNALSDRDVYLNPYAAPLKDVRCAPDTREMISNYDIRGDVQTTGHPNFLNNINAGIPINIPTQGCLASSCHDTPYRQIGILSNNGEVLPLMGRPVILNRDKWQFYTIGRNGIKLPIKYNNRACSGEYGCDNVSSGDSVTVEGYNREYIVTIYENNSPRYLPVI